MGADGQPKQTTKHATALPVLQGILPLETSRIPTEALAGVTLAALAIPEVMGYSSIAGMPVVTGLYTLLLPVLLFALLGSSRHLVVGADSATAAVMAAALAGMAATGSQQYVELAGALCIVVAVLLVVARLARLGFLADFLSRTVLIGFLTGVGVQVAMGQLPDIFGIPGISGSTLEKFWETLTNLDETSMSTLAVALGTMAVILGMKKVTGKIPGALVAVVGSIAISYFFDLADHGVTTVGSVTSGLPSLGIPDVSWSQVWELVPTALSIVVLVLAQSAATSRAYSAKYDEHFEENLDIIGLAAASAGAGLSGTYVVNGSPTKTQMVDGAGGRSQLAQLSAGLVVVIVLLFLTGPLEYMPNATLAAVVFLIGIELVDVAGMKRVFATRKDEFVVAAITAVTVVAVGVEQAIILAIVLSLIDHVRHSYKPSRSVLAPAANGRWAPTPVTPDARSADGLVVYRYSASVYYANANGLLEDVKAFLGSTDEGGSPIRWFVLDAEAVNDVDYTAAQTLQTIVTDFREHGIHFAVAGAAPKIAEELRVFGLTGLIPPEAQFESVDDAVAAFRASS